MMQIPLSIGALHFVGIGGIGMSGIADVMRTLGYSVSGSDMAENANVRRLRENGVEIAIGHRAENVDGAAVLVVSSAIRPDNPELVAARERFIPVVRRAEMLAELMRLKWSVAVGGTHGKTTTTSLVAAVLDGGGLDPTVINGGVINAYGANARIGAGDWMVVEADESDGSFTKLPATIAIVTNIDAEHMDHYGSLQALRQAFQTFVQNIPFYGFAVLCVDHPEVQSMIGQIEDRRVITYGFNPQAEVRAAHIRPAPHGYVFDVIVAPRGEEEQTIQDIAVPMFGHHNIQNSLAAIAVGIEMGVPADSMREALRRFAGVKRRFTRTGEANGVTVIDDYAHHPVEINAVLKAARDATSGRVIAVVQPHRYTRLRDLFEEFCSCFNDADTVVVAPVFEAGEAPIEGVDRDALIQGLRTRGHRSVAAIDGPEDLPDVIADAAASGDLVICLGAGSITQWANALPAQLAKRGAS
ncbi:MAG: UDP-N-acetylmuramate--L-alanine ligase [Alphaproteobacteria bacterium]|nr:UDP-N-acetylmuramate--L-alanine ligase [Alphaproteobacteria bacterium]